MLTVFVWYFTVSITNDLLIPHRIQIFKIYILFTVKTVEILGAQTVLKS
jgi:hypothetical protein